MTVRALAAATALAALSPAARANEAFLAAEAVPVKELPGPLPADPAAPVWDGIPAASLTAAPQRTIRLHDRRANQALAAAPNRAVAVRAASDGRSLALLLEWDDATEDRTSPDATDEFGDGAALELPLRFGAGVRLPYVGMGDEEQPVAILAQRAEARGTAGREAVASGYGSLRRADLGGARFGMRYDRASHSWRALFLRPLAAGDQDLRRGLVPFAVAVWDGARAERGGNKALSGWKFLRLPRYAIDNAYLAEVSWGYAPGDLGSPAKGKELVEGMCTPCHHIGALRIAPPGLAPDLGAIGAIAAPGYLRDSIVNPSAVLVPSPNPGQHYDRSAKPDARGAYPSDEGYLWVRREQDGRKTSTMPDYGSMPKEDLAAVVAYLRTLGADAPAGRRQP
jgi:complex iron-sulfur molybdoenzyme family reductase subunit gamma